MNRKQRLILHLAAVVSGMALLIGGVVVVEQTIATAHTAALSGSATCQTDGTYTVAWTLDTANVPSPNTATVTLNNYNPPGSSVTGLPVSGIAPNASAGFTQKAIPGSSHEADLGVDVTWTDGVKTTAPGIVPLPGTCTTPTPPTTVPVTTPTTSPPASTPTTAPPTVPVAPTAAVPAPTPPQPTTVPTPVPVAHPTAPLPNIAPGPVTAGNG